MCVCVLRNLGTCAVLKLSSSPSVCVFTQSRNIELELFSLPPDEYTKAQFVDSLMHTLSSEAVFLLTTFVNMARSCSAESREEMHFINTIAVVIFEVS